MRRLFFLFPFFFSVLVVQGQIHDPVKWNFTQDGEWLVFSATIEEGWHLYGFDIPEDGPQALEFTFDKVENVELVGKIVGEEKAVEKYDALFGMTVRYYEKRALFKQKTKPTQAKTFAVSGEVKYMLCNDVSCLPPKREAFLFGKTSDTENTATDVANGNFFAPAQEFISPQVNEQEWWKPVVEELKALGDKTLATHDAALWFIFLMGFLGGFIALLTPCVWPMIPMTISFFLKHKQEKKRGRWQVVIYGLSIVLIYVLLGLLVTAIFGANALNDLSTNAFFNLLFFALLVLFSISFFGAFDLALPASWSNRLDQKADAATGLLSIFFMAFTLVLVSFSCTGPIIGTLLVQAATNGSMLSPAIGMFGFALALALPFTFFAFFPAWLQSLPKSGGWLNMVKVVLGFLELALALKFLSVADLAYGWGILNRELFLALWIVIFALLGLYLLGKIRLPHDSETNKISPTRLMFSLLSFAFAVYMIPGLWGAPLKSISAFAPPLSTQTFNLYPGEVRAQFEDYNEGMAFAAKIKKPALIDFTGYGCVNCRKMEAAVWTEQTVKYLIDNDFVLISLHVDDKRPLAITQQVEENGKTTQLKSHGDRWSYLQRMKFGANAQPFYVVLDNNGNPLTPSYAFSEDARDFARFLQQGRDSYKDNRNEK